MLLIFRRGRCFRFRIRRARWSHVDVIERSVVRSWTTLRARRLVGLLRRIDGCMWCHATGRVRRVWCVRTVHRTTEASIRIVHRWTRAFRSWTVLIIARAVVATTVVVHRAWHHAIRHVWVIIALIIPANDRFTIQ